MEFYARTAKLYVDGQEHAVQVLAASHKDWSCEATGQPLGWDARLKFRCLCRACWAWHRMRGR